MRNIRIQIYTPRVPSLLWGENSGSGDGSRGAVSHPHRAAACTSYPGQDPGKAGARNESVQNSKRVAAARKGGRPRTWRKRLGKTPKAEDIHQEILRTLSEARQAKAGLRQVLRRCASAEERATMGSWIFLLNSHIALLEKFQKQGVCFIGQQHRVAVWSMVQLVQGAIDTIIATWL